MIRRGYTILAQNYQIKGGEIDIIAQYGDLIVFFEVKYRQNEDFGHPLDTFTIEKRRALRRTIFAYIHAYKIDPDAIRVDFIGILGTQPNHEIFHEEGVEI